MDFGEHPESRRKEYPMTAALSSTGAESSSKILLTAAIHVNLTRAGRRNTAKSPEPPPQRGIAKQDVSYIIAGNNNRHVMRHCKR